MKNPDLRKFQLGKKKETVKEIVPDTTGAVDMEIDNNFDEFDYLQSLAIEEDVGAVPIPTFVKLNIEKEQNYSVAESFFLPEARESDSDSDSEEIATQNYTQF